MHVQRSVGVVAVVLATGCIALAQQSIQKPAPAPQADPPATTLRAQWEMEGPPAPPGGARPPFDVTAAQSYVYKIYVVGSATGTTLTGVACTTTADPFTKTCAATVPSTMSTPGLNLDLTAVINGIETAHSTPAVVPPLVTPRNPPSNLRMLRVGEVTLVALNHPDGGGWLRLARVTER